MPSTGGHVPGKGLLRRVWPVEHFVQALLQARHDLQRLQLCSHPPAGPLCRRTQSEGLVLVGGVVVVVLAVSRVAGGGSCDGKKSLVLCGYCEKMSGGKIVQTLQLNVINLNCFASAIKRYINIILKWSLKA